MRSGNTYRAARRNETNKHGKRHLNPNFERYKNSGEITHVVFNPPVRQNKKLAEGELRYKAMVIPYTAEIQNPHSGVEPVFSYNTEFDGMTSTVAA